MLRSFAYAASASRDPATARRRPTAGRTRCATRSSTGYLASVDQRAAAARRGRASSGCSPSSSWRRRSTSCATSSTTGPTGRRSRVAGILPPAGARLPRRPHDRPSTRKALGPPTRRTGASSCALPPRRPTASSRTSEADARADVELQARPATGCSRASSTDAKLPLRYELEVAYPDGNTFTMRDPYSFAPTLGELDLHLGGRGAPRGALRAARRARHARSTASPAPRSRSGRRRRRRCRVVGDFNSWDGRLHPMRVAGRRRASGSCSCPGVEPGARYKFEIRTQDGELRHEGRPVRVRGRAPAADRLGRAPPASTSGATTRGSPSARAQVARTASRSRSTRCTSARGGAAPRTRTRRSPTASWPTQLARLRTDMGFTHVELLPVMAHPVQRARGATR